MLIALAWGIFGLIIGSFLNVIIIRHGARSLQGRSECFSCSKKLAWYELVPVFSWIAQGGRCRGCGARISIQYPIVEALTAIAFACIGGAPLSLLWQVFAAVIAGLFIVIAVYDIQHTIIPNEWVWAFNILALFSVLYMPSASYPLSLALAAGPLVALPLFLLWFVSRGAWMGFGDVKFALGMGWLLGIGAGMTALLLSFIIGALVSVCILLPLPHLIRALRITRFGRSNRRFTMKSEVAFGPFLIAATALVWILGMYGITIPLI